MKTRSVEDRLKGMARQLAYHREQLQNARNEAADAKVEMIKVSRMCSELDDVYAERDGLELRLEEMSRDYESRINYLEGRGVTKKHERDEIREELDVKTRLIRTAKIMILNHLRGDDPSEQEWRWMLREMSPGENP